ncbi:TPA: translesion error-prone DNA polymerase V subunit UmuC [Escherichia coli]|nr:translesion error-prone DNA polymerase V subunit UmuC [Escherichia coli]
MFALCDVNAFYASCETVFRPDLWGKPVVVLSNNDGCVIARNAEAKALGVKMGDPWFKQKDLFRRCGVVCFSSNYELYADMSNRVMSTLEELSPRVEIYSIDEAFCDLTGVRNCRDLTDFGREIRATVLQRTHLTVGVGIAQTKTLAKLANHAAKKWQRQTGGVVDLSNLERQRKLMSALPVDDVWGIGRRISKKLDAMGIKTVLDLADTDIRFIRKHFNVVLERTVRELRGEPCLQLEEFAPTKQDSRDIINAATRSLDAIWQAGHRYQKAGVMLGDFFSQGVAQLNLFDDNAPRPGSEQLMTVMDTLNAKEGRGTLYFAGQGIQQQWQMKRAMLSPRYTTRSSDLLRVK